MLVSFLFGFFYLYFTLYIDAHVDRSGEIDASWRFPAPGISFSGFLSTPLPPSFWTLLIPSSGLSYISRTVEWPSVCQPVGPTGVEILTPGRSITSRNERGGSRPKKRGARGRREDENASKVCGRVPDHYTEENKFGSEWA